MISVFHGPDREALAARIGKLEPHASRLWGKMDPAQMLAHSTIAFEAATGDRPMRQGLPGKLVAWLVLGRVLGTAPFGKGAPTDSSFVVSDARDFARERERLLAVLGRFVNAGPASAGRFQHVFFGKLTGDEWGILMAKHLDHHLRQFGA